MERTELFSGKPSRMALYAQPPFDDSVVKSAFGGRLPGTPEHIELSNRMGNFVALYGHGSSFSNIDWAVDRNIIFIPMTDETRVSIKDPYDVDIVLHIPLEDSDEEDGGDTSEEDEDDTVGEDEDGIGEEDKDEDEDETSEEGEDGTGEEDEDDAGEVEEGP